MIGEGAAQRQVQKCGEHDLWRRTHWAKFRQDKGASIDSVIFPTMGLKSSDNMKRLSL
jgi:hypothetical protein